MKFAICESVSARHRRTAAVSFSAANGSITGLLGANGAGKTTCLRIVARVLQPDSGSVELDAPLDHTDLYARLTVRENLAYFGKLQRIPSLQLIHRIKQLLTKLDLQHVADRRAAGLSLGESTKSARCLIRL